ncbi:RpiB/LacA/LacB family sugar-phosphate isomerase [Gloeobacter kilaueensis]|uniref:Ribose 5-phosphate isomerase B n=1 Tax=Gloeobacter kilaueensis (strain ATCC BAA-2537 / CCAP 1431/1 / ULC 316 / JS1) TaxID=1183438 RepID=U5QI07_GLOK1|nr:RpiB/LacA/LacB family sugar-phosphate isomerase [Gloeobacter kilaueensis]AGY58612.1 ribose 5-phosphate isomerase B [Gloeobacter kilaueensis JS1]
MKIAVGSDEKNYLTDALVQELEGRGHELLLIGPLAGTGDAWPAVGEAVGEAVGSGRSALGIVCCYTGTGVSIAANKVTGVRAALCGDAQTAAGARRWNDANVLALSLRTTTPDLLREILDAWFGTDCPASERVYVEQIRAIEEARNQSVRSLHL